MLNWNDIDTVLLDLDGTLLDLHFDNHFWLHHLPRRFAERHGISEAEAKAHLQPRLAAVEGTLPWYCLDYWARELDMDIVAIKREIADLIAVKPLVPEFLLATRDRGKRIVMVTNGHRAGLALKMEQTGLELHFDKIYTAHDFGAAKEDAAFWSALAAVEPFDPRRTLLVDDNLNVARQARACGVAHIVVPLQPDSRREARKIEGFLGLNSFGDLL